MQVRCDKANKYWGKTQQLFSFEMLFLGFSLCATILCNPTHWSNIVFQRHVVWLAVIVALISLSSVYRWLAVTRSCFDYSSFLWWYVHIQMKNRLVQQGYHSTRCLRRITRTSPCPIQQTQVLVKRVTIIIPTRPSHKGSSCFSLPFNFICFFLFLFFSAPSGMCQET